MDSQEFFVEEIVQSVSMCKVRWSWVEVLCEVRMRRRVLVLSTFKAFL